jgi:hypothetical protein
MAYALKEMIGKLSAMTFDTPLVADEPYNDIPPTTMRRP